MTAGILRADALTLPLADGEHFGLPALFWRRVEFVEATGCWQWKTPSPDGYGKFMLRGIRKRAHRWTFESIVGPVPSDKVLDHVCRNRACVRPSHLRIVTSRENTLAAGSLAIAARHARKTTCPQGHKYDKVLSGKRRCSACLREQRSASKARRR